jgi:hypothetical protein
MHPNASRRPMLDYFKTEEENKGVEVPVGMIPWWNLYTGVKVAIPSNLRLTRIWCLHQYQRSGSGCNEYSVSQKKKVFF